jgi:MFS family permease
MAGALGAGTSQGTWIITSYAVAEAVVVPLTGWLATRLGSVRLFVACILGFAVSSLLCSLANSMGMMIGARILQGISGGPIMPLAQTLFNGVDGIEGLTITRYAVTITRRSDVPWETLVDDVRDALRDFFL